MDSRLTKKLTHFAINAQVVSDQNFHIGFNRIYDWSLANGLRRIFAQHRQLFADSDKPFKVDLAANCKSIRDFDEAVTSVQFGWPTVDTYYAGSGSADSIPDVTIPLLCIQVHLAIADPPTLWKGRSPVAWPLSQLRLSLSSAHSMSVWLPLFPCL